MLRLKKIFKKIAPGLYKLVSTIKNKLYQLKVMTWKRIFNNPKKLMINIGGGKWYKKYWKVLDFQGKWYSFNKCFLDYDYDLTSKKTLPFKDNSVDFFYSEHTIEHIDDESVAHIFFEIFRTLKLGGAVRIVVPDMDLAYQKFFEKNEDFFKYWTDYYNTNLTKAFLVLFAFPESEIEEADIKDKFGKLNKNEFFDFYTKHRRQNLKEAGRHINWFNFMKIEKLLKDAGFKVVYESRPQQSRFKEMRGKNFDTRPSWSLHVESMKT